VILKGYRTIVATPDGAVYVNPTGNPGMATGGSGDILTGLLAGIAAQPLGSFTERLCLAVYLHGLAGDLAAAALGEESVVAGDLLQFLPEAWKEIRKR
jgi:NAD(P)H-hydrate epimerase